MNLLAVEIAVQQMGDLVESVHLEATSREVGISPVETINYKHSNFEFQNSLKNEAEKHFLFALHLHRCDLIESF